MYSTPRFSTHQGGDVYVDFIRDDQTVLTRSVELHHGRGDISFALTPETYGALQVHAYQISPTSDVVRDVRKIFIAPAKDLMIRQAKIKRSIDPAKNPS